MLSRYEQFLFKQWLRVYTRTKMIKHNKDLLENVGDTLALLEKPAHLLIEVPACRDGRCISELAGAVRRAAITPEKPIAKHAEHDGSEYTPRIPPLPEPHRHHLAGAREHSEPRQYGQCLGR